MIYEQIEFDFTEVMPPIAPDEEHLERPKEAEIAPPEEVHR